MFSETYYNYDHFNYYTTTLGYPVTTTTIIGPGFCLSDSPCRHGWPYHEGDLRQFNEKVYACDVFEVCHQDLRDIADEAIDCCENGCNSNCHNFCDKARSDGGITSNPTQEQIKKCSAFYLALGLGPAATIMEGYYQAEIDCADPNIPFVDCGYPGLECKGCLDPIYNPSLNRDDPNALCGWSSDTNSDTDMSKNSCYLSDLPAHVDVSILHTGICMDYSIVLTTLLRLVGYSKDEAFSELGADGPSDCGNSPNCQIRPECCSGHAWNIVLLPGESKWLILDTTGNIPSPYELGGVPGTPYDYCSALGIFNGESIGNDGCINDAIKRICPSRGETHGC